MQTLLPLAEKIGARLKQRGETIAIAESSTGGLLSAALLSVAGASVYFRGGSVIYTAYARSGFLDIPNPLPPPIERASTEPYALLLADIGPQAPRCHMGTGRDRSERPHGKSIRGQGGTHLHRLDRPWILQGDHVGDRGCGPRGQHACLFRPSPATSC
jgi:nicotinamide-nucleotide amidase